MSTLFDPADMPSVKCKGCYGQRFDYHFCEGCSMHRNDGVLRIWNERMEWETRKKLIVGKMKKFIQKSHLRLFDCEGDL